MGNGLTSECSDRYSLIKGISSVTEVVFRRSLVRKLTIDGNELRRLALGNSLVAYRRHYSHCRYRRANLRSSLVVTVDG